jgi:hypothetical protein
LEQNVRLTLELTKCVLENLTSCPNWRGFCARYPDAVLEFRDISSLVSQSDAASGDLERAAALLTRASSLRVRCDELV